MILRRRPRGYLWLSLPWTVLLLAGVVLVGLALIGVGSTALEPRHLPGTVFFATVLSLPFLIETRRVWRVADRVHVRWLFGRFEAPAEGTWIDVRWNASHKYVVWVSPTREVRLAWSVSTRRVIRLAEEIAHLLDLPHHVDPAVREAAL